MLGLHDDGRRPQFKVGVLIGQLDSRLISITPAIATISGGFMDLLLVVKGPMYLNKVDCGTDASSEGSSIEPMAEPMTPMIPATAISVTVSGIRLNHDITTVMVAAMDYKVKDYLFPKIVSFHIHSLA